MSVVVKGDQREPITPRDVPYVSDCVAKLKNDVPGKFRGAPVAPDI
jgi:hypothetical protein